MKRTAQGPGRYTPVALVTGANSGIGLPIAIVLEETAAAATTPTGWRAVCYQGDLAADAVEGRPYLPQRPDIP